MASGAQAEQGNGVCLGRVKAEASSSSLEAAFPLLPGVGQTRNFPRLIGPGPDTFVSVVMHNVAHCAFCQAVGLGEITNEVAMLKLLSDVYYRVFLPCE